MRRALVILLIRLLRDDGDIIMVDKAGRVWIPLDPTRWAR